MFKRIDDVVKVAGFTVTAYLERDNDSGPPWEEDYGHGPVSEWTARDKRPGERQLCGNRRGGRYYDVQEAIAIAKRDGWDAPPYGGTPGQKAARAVEADYKRLRDWCNDEWWYIGVVLRVSKGDVMLSEHAASLWGIESDAGEHLVDLANELLDEALDEGRRLAHSVCGCDDAAYVG
jgi:hypothetical protein